MNTPHPNNDLFNPTTLCRRTIIQLPAFLCALSSFMIACTATNSQITPIVDLPAQGSVAENIQVFELGEPINKPYKILGKTFARRETGLDDESSRDKLKNSLKPLAAKMGADAVIGFYSSDQDDRGSVGGTRHWCSGLAVKFVPENQVAPASFVVAIARVPEPTFEEWKQWSQKNTDAKDFRKFLQETRQRNQWLYSATQYQLEKLGYYATVVPVAVPGMSLSSLKTLDQTTIDTLFGLQTGLILTTEFSGGGVASALTFSVETSEVTASLFAKRTRSVIWTNWASGWDLALDPANILGIAYPWQSVAVSNAIKSLYKTLMPAEQFVRVSAEPAAKKD